MNRHYKKKVSGFETWDQKQHACQYLIFPNNIGPYLSIDELSLSKGELYTFVTNKEGKGKKGSIVAVIMGTKADDIQGVLEKISHQQRNLVKEVTLDMAKNMEAGVRRAFPNASLVTDRFHVAKLALDSLQHIRVKLRWAEIDKENNAIAALKKAKKELNKALEICQDDAQRNKLHQDYQLEIANYQIIEFENGDTPKQLLARSRYILSKKENQWTENQKNRAHILFKNYPELETGYHEILAFRNIYEQTNINVAEIKFEQWIKKVHDEELKPFYSLANTVKNNLDNILNFFKNRNTNANAESFNSKLKLFRANLRGVVDTEFFLFRLYKLFA